VPSRLDCQLHARTVAAASEVVTMFRSVPIDPADRAVLNLPHIRELSAVTRRRAMESHGLVCTARADLSSQRFAVVAHGRTVRVNARRPISGASGVEHAEPRVKAQAPHRARPILVLAVSGPKVHPFEIDVYCGMPGRERKVAHINAWPGN